MSGHVTARLSEGFRCRRTLTRMDVLAELRHVSSQLTGSHTRILSICSPYAYVGLLSGQYLSAIAIGILGTDRSASHLVLM